MRNWLFSNVKNKVLVTALGNINFDEKRTSLIFLLKRSAEDRLSWPTSVSMSHSLRIFFFFKERNVHFHGAHFGSFLAPSFWPDFSLSWQSSHKTKEVFDLSKGGRKIIGSAYKTSSLDRKLSTLDHIHSGT